MSYMTSMTSYFPYTSRGKNSVKQHRQTMALVKSKAVFAEGVGIIDPCTKLLIKSKKKHLRLR